MTKLALYPGCLMLTEQYAYEMSLRATLPLFDIELVPIPDFSCCGEPLKSVKMTLLELPKWMRRFAPDAGHAL